MLVSKIHPSLLTDCQIALAVTSGLSWTARPVGRSLTAANAQRPRKEEVQARIALVIIIIIIIIIWTEEITLEPYT
jgi:hypothetical protein